MGSDYNLLKEFLINSIPSDFVRSVFIAGSAQGTINLGSDVDLFLIVYENHLDAFLDLFTEKITHFIEEHPSFVYSYFRGPIKFEHKKLIHCVIYTDGQVGRVQDFQNEPPQVFEGILRKYEVILGEDPIIIKPEMNLTEKSHEEREAYMRRKANFFWKENKVVYREWVKHSDTWSFDRSEIILNPWQKEHLAKYFIDYKPV